LGTVQKIRWCRVFAWLMGATLIVILLFLLCGSALLVTNHRPAGRVDAAVVLQGSIVGQKVRTAGAVNLLQQGIADRVLLSLPKESYWGQSIPPIARAYLERTFGTELASRVDFCETTADVNSTVEEMQALSPCIREHQWQSIVVVTSSYHTRRAGMIWKRLAAHDPNIHVWIVGVDDPEFQLPWWRHRESAKLLVMEMTKLVWTTFGG